MPSDQPRLSAPTRRSPRRGPNGARFSRRLRRALRRELRPGERLRWIGHPSRRPADEHYPFFTFLATGLTLVGVAMALATGVAYLADDGAGDLILPAQCRVLLIAAGTLVALFLPFALAHLWSTRILYALTSLRAIIWPLWWLGRVGLESHPLDQLGPIYVRRPRRDDETDKGGGDVVVREREEAAGEAGLVTFRTSFRNLIRPDHVRRLAIAARRQTRPAAADRRA